MAAPESSYGKDEMRPNSGSAGAVETHAIRSMDAELTINGVQHRLPSLT